LKTPTVDLARGVEEEERRSTVQAFSAANRGELVWTCIHSGDETLSISCDIFAAQFRLISIYFAESFTCKYVNAKKE